MKGSLYRIMVESAPARIAIDAAGVRLAESTKVRVLRATRQPPTYYFPHTDVALSCLQHCAPTARSRAMRDIGTLWWATLASKTPCGATRHLLKAHRRSRVYSLSTWDAMDACCADGEQIIEPAGVVIDAPNPHAMWLMHAADHSLPPERMLAAFATHLREQGFPLLRLGVLVRTLHPLVFAWGGLDWRGRSAPETFEMPYEVLRAEELRLSPYAPILGGEGGVRRRIDPRARADFPILEDLARRGATDYAAMPMQFSDGQINILTLVADGAEGFTTDQRGPMHEVLPLLSSIFEVSSHRRTASVLIETYLGRQTITGVLAGKVRRGDSEAIHAVVWFSDLRASTRLTEALWRHEYLELLNDYFDCMAGAVLAYEGEVLKYIGDAVMANLLWLIRTNYAQSRRLLRSPLPATHLLAWIASTARAVSAALIPLASVSRCIGASSPTEMSVRQDAWISP